MIVKPIQGGGSTAAMIASTKKAVDAGRKLARMGSDAAQALKSVPRFSHAKGGSVDLKA